MNELSRLGVTLCGLGGLGVEVAERLNNRFHGRPEHIGLHALYVDSVRADGYANSSGPFELSFDAAESRFLASNADYTAVLQHIAAGNPPDWAPPISASEGRSILQAKLPIMIGFGGQPVISFVAASLAWPGWEQKVDASLRAAKTVDPSTEPLTVVIASLYGGTGLGHLPLFLRKLKELGQENVAVFVALPSQAEGLLHPAQIPDAHARGIAGLRGLLRPGFYRHLFLVGSDNRALSANPRGSAVEVIASTIAAWLENPAAFRSEQATWLGQDLQGAATAERLSALGAAEVVFPADTLARAQSCYYAAQAWRMVTQIEAAELHHATGEGELFAWTNPMTAELDAVTKAPLDASAVAIFDEQVVHGQVQKMYRRFSVPLLETEPLDPQSVRSVLDGQPRKMLSEDLVRRANAFVRDNARDVETSMRKARALNLASFTTTIRTKLAEQLGGKDGVNLADRPWVLRFAAEFMGAAAGRLEVTAARIMMDLARVRTEAEPQQRAQKAVEYAESALPPKIRTRGHFMSSQATRYLDAVQTLFSMQMLDLALTQLADHLRALAAACRAQVRPLEELVSELDLHRQACIAGEKDFTEHLRHLQKQSTLVVVPDAQSALEALTSELARAAAGDTRSDLALSLLSSFQVHLELGGSNQPGRPVLTMPLIDGFSAAAMAPRTENSRSTGAVASNGTVSVMAASYLPALAYSQLQPQYASCTLADALATDYAHGWATDQGGHTDRDLIKQFLREKVTSPLLSAGESTVKLVGDVEEVSITRQSVHLDRRPARGLRCVADGIAELVVDTIAQQLDEKKVRVADGPPGRATMTTVVNRVPWHRIVEFSGKAMENYHRVTRLPVHLDPAALRAYRIEQRAREAGRLGDRILDPDVMLLLDDPKALWGFLGLVATNRMPVQDTDLIGTDGPTYRIDLALPSQRRAPEWRTLGPSNDPLAALQELFDSHDSQRLRAAVVETWQQEQAKLVLDCGNDPQQARDLIQLALRNLTLPTGIAGERFAADVALLVEMHIY